MKVYDYLVAFDAKGAGVTELVDATVLKHCTTAAADDLGGSTQWRVRLVRPYAVLSSAEKVLWRAALWLADQGGELPAFSEAQDRLDPEDYDAFRKAVGERLAGAW